MSGMSYNCGARAYLKRAKQQLDTGTKEALFYAAFELRSGIEGRLQEYLHAQAEVSKRKKEGWQIVKLARNLEEAVPLGGRVMEMLLMNPESGKSIHTYFTPVTSKLKDNGCRLGDYLHCMKKAHPDNDPWWAQTREFLAATYDELLLATAGTVLAPPMMKPKGKDFTLNVELAIIPEHDAFFLELGKPGKDMRMKVAYSAAVPAAYLSTYKAALLRTRYGTP